MSGPLVTIGACITFNGHGEVLVRESALEESPETLRFCLEQAFFFSREPTLREAACAGTGPLAEYDLRSH